MHDRKRARWGQGRRLEFIDFRLYWDGRVNRADLMDHFGVSVPQASLDLARYIELAPKNIEYDRTQKAYIATARFSPALVSPRAEGYLNQLLAIEVGLIGANSSFVGFFPPVDAVHDPARVVDPRALRAVLECIRERKTLQINYQSMTRPLPALRNISPHAFGYDGFRWHIRAYCHEDRDYRDFVFARILEHKSGREDYVSGNTDDEWNTEIEAIITPNPELTDVQRRAIELDFGMAEGRLVLKTRRALLFYLLKHLGLLPNEENAAVTQQVILANRKDLHSFFGAHGLRDGNESNQ